MLQNSCKTLGFKKIMVYKIPPGGRGKPYPASGLIILVAEYVSMTLCAVILSVCTSPQVKLSSLVNSFLNKCRHRLDVICDL